MSEAYSNEAVALQVYDVGPPQVNVVEMFGADNKYVLFQTWPFTGYGLTPNARHYIHGKVRYGMFKDTIHPMLEKQGFNIFWRMEN